MAKRERIEQGGRRVGKSARAKRVATIGPADVALARMVRDSERGGFPGYVSAESVAFRALLAAEGVDVVEYDARWDGGGGDGE